MSAALEHYRKEWSEARSSLPGAGIDWVERVRREALDRFCERGFPTPRDEDWKYTSVRPIERRAFRLGLGASAGDESPVAAVPAERRVDGLQPTATLVFRNGRLSPAESDVRPAVRDGLRVESLADVLDSEPERVEQALSGPGERNAFADLNRAFLGDGAVVSIDRGAVIDRPIELVFSTRGESEVASHPVVLVLAGEDSGAMIVEHHLGAGEGAKLANPHTLLSVGKRARIEHHLLLDEDGATWHVGNIEARVAAGGRLGSNAVQLGGRLVRYGIEVALEGDGASAVLNGLYVPARAAACRLPYPDRSSRARRHERAGLQGPPRRTGQRRVQRAGGRASERTATPTRARATTTFCCRRTRRSTPSHSSRSLPTT